MSRGRGEITVKLGTRAGRAMVRVVRLPTLLFLAAAALHAAEPNRAPALRIEEIAAPAAANALGASLAVSSDGTAWLSWLERDGPATALRCATFDAEGKRWGEARTIASGRDWFINAADFPALTLGANGSATAVWFVNNPVAPAHAAAAHDHDGPGYRAVLSRTEDGGRTWSSPAELTRESDAVEFVSLVTLADGRVLAAWLDGRARKRGGKTQQLFARVLGAEAPDMLVDPSVCDCCQTSLTAFPDGSALLAYRGRTDDEVRDIKVARFRGGAWETPRTLNRDEWKIAGCPVNGPQLASDGGRVAAAWFTAADNNPRVLASLSADAGTRFLLPVEISHTKPAGRVDTLLLHDGALLVTWVDVTAALWLRRVTPDFATAEPTLLASPREGRATGFPRTALLRDYTGGKTAAECLVAFTTDGPRKLRTLLATVREGDLVEAERNCECAPSADELRGFSLRGRIESVATAGARVRVQHGEVPGIFAAGAAEFRIDPRLVNAMQPGREFLGRIERRDGAWWLFNVRLLAVAR